MERIGYGLDNRGLITERNKIFYFSTASKSALGLKISPSQWVSGSFSPGVKQPLREADHSPPSSAQLKNGGAILLLPHTSSWHSA
jgi:hypothetical protein